MQRTALVLVLAAVAVSRATLDAPGLACAGPLIDPTLDAGSPFGPAAFGLGAVEPRAASLDLTGPRVGAARHVDVEVMQLMPDARGVLGGGLSPDDVSIQAISLTWRSAFEGPLSPHVGLGPALFLTSLAERDARLARRPWAGVSYSLSRDLSLFGGYRFTRSIYDVTGIEVDGGRTGSSLINDHSFRGGITLKFW